MAKRITITLEDDVLKWLDENINKKRFYNYQHAVLYCIRHVMSGKCITIPEDIANRINKVIEAGAIGYTSQEGFILEAIRRLLKELGYAP